jgi:hypothetical protein
LLDRAHQRPNKSKIAAPAVIKAKTGIVVTSDDEGDPIK